MSNHKSLHSRLALASRAVLICIVASVLSGEGLHAAISVSTDASDFVLTQEVYPATAITTADISSVSGNTTLRAAIGIGDPATINHGILELVAGLAGLEYAMSGDENFDVLFSSPQTAFAFNYLDDSIDSDFALSFYSGGSLVGSSSFTSSAPFSTAKFIGLTSTIAFDKIEFRENDGSGNSNEYFQFFNAEVATIPEPSSALFGGLATCCGGVLRRRRRR